MRTKRAFLEKLHEQGLWNGPVAFLKNEMKYAYQLLGNKSFMGVFKKGAFKDVALLDPTSSILYLGKPGDLFQPVLGRDKIRDTDGGLKILVSMDDLQNLDVNVPAKKEIVKAGILTAVAPEPSSVLLAYQLDHSRQNNIIIPSAFDNYEVQLVGVGPVGLEIAVQLVKMGLKKLSIYDPREFSEKDPAVCFARILDPHRSMATAAAEIMGDQTLRSVSLNYRWPLAEDIVGNVVINTSSDIETRRNLWALIKENKKVGVLIDAQVSGVTGKVFVIDPRDPESVELYEDDMANFVPSNDAIIYTVLTIAGFAAGAFQRYVSTPGENCCLDRLYIIDMNVIYSDAGCWGKVGR